MRWTDLVGCALLGTARREITPGDAPSEVRELLADADGVPEHRLLRHAGVLSLYRQAGALPVRVSGAGGAAAAAPESRPLCSRAASADAAHMLDGPFAVAKGWCTDPMTR